MNARLDLLVIPAERRRNAPAAAAICCPRYSPIYDAPPELFAGLVTLLERGAGLALRLWSHALRAAASRRE